LSNNITLTSPQLHVFALQGNASTVNSMRLSFSTTGTQTMWRVCSRTHVACSLLFPHLDQVACKRCTELNGLSVLGKLSMSNSNLSAVEIPNTRPWIVNVVSMNDLEITSRPLAMRTLAYSAARLIALAWSRPCE
ncbi:MAG: hypothetical protein ACKPKO_49295, partial [Candidatus Fonsibacter sp.]